MKIEKSWLYLAVFMAVSIGGTYGPGISGAILIDVPSQKRADVITIESMTAFGKLEKPPVEFLHDAHTEALARKKLDCTACHPTKNNRIYSKFKRLEDTNRTEVMNTYHKGCIACHGEMTLAHEKTGPVDCDDCHTGEKKYVSSRRSMGFDKSLHFAHAKNSKNKCEQCHHAYNETKKELFYDKGKEGSCRYCHEKKTENNRISMRQASHLACINCHINTPVKEQINPPVTCARCHDPLEQQKIKKLTDIPRMDRHQPDILLLKSTPKSFKADEKRNWMNFVPFDHKAHEASNDTCRVCHHASLQPCIDCHTLNGSPKSLSGKKAVNLEIALHKVDSTRSCQGCHNTGKQEKNCAGCHVLIHQTSQTPDKACSKCHSVPAQNMPGASTPEDEAALARSALQDNKAMTATYHKDQIPEIVTIQSLSKEYEAVKLPHRQIINALAARIKDNRLSGYFHTEKDVICQGCHHHSPASLKPPQCANCHGRQWDEKRPSIPGILGAYHLQCLGCHKQMGLEKPVGCVECHKKKALG
jgi:hypothetical protein